MSRPFKADPPMSRAHGHHPALWHSLADCRDRQNRQTERTGLDGPMMSASLASIASMTPCAGLENAAPSNRMSSTSSNAAHHKVLLEADPIPVRHLSWDFK